MEAKDSLVVDGLFDVYNKCAMGNCAENTAKKLQISREDQDEHCLSSYTRSEESWKAGLFDEEIAAVTVKGRKGDTVIKEDEDYKKLLKDKFRSLKPTFVKENGTVTAANSSTLNDGASAVVLASGDIVEKEGLKPLAKILGQRTCGLLDRSVDILRLRRCCVRSHRLPNSTYPRCPSRAQGRRRSAVRHCALGIQRGVLGRRLCS